MLHAPSTAHAAVLATVYYAAYVAELLLECQINIDTSSWPIQDTLADQERIGPKRKGPMETPGPVHQQLRQLPSQATAKAKVSSLLYPGAHAVADLDHAIRPDAVYCCSARQPTQASTDNRHINLYMIRERSLNTSDSADG